jgi:tetratricopeptide (TPR) repeat protein
MISPTSLPSGDALRDICVTELLLDDISKPYIRKLLRAKTYRALLPEAVLQDLGSTLGGCLDGLLVKLLSSAPPNSVHHYVASQYPSLFTTNFDLCLEQCAASRVHHLHGSIAQPESLQNRLYRLGKTSSAQMRLFGRTISRKPLLVLGYSLRDTDVVDAIRQNGPSEIFYLARSGTVPANYARLNAAVYVAPGSAQDLFNVRVRGRSRAIPTKNLIRQPSVQRRANALERLCFRAAQYELEVAVVTAYLPLLRGRSRVQALCGLANTLRVMGQFDDAVNVCRTVIKSAAARKPENGDVLSTAYVVLGLCDLDSEKGNYREIEKSFRVGLAIFEKLLAREKHSQQSVENDIWRARIFNNLGLVAAAQGRYNRAIKYYLRSCALKRRHFEEYGLAQTTSNLAKTYIAMDQLKLAADCLDQVASWMEKIPDPYICGDAILEVLQALQRRGLIKMPANRVRNAASQSATWWGRQATRAHPKVHRIMGTLAQLRRILSTIES